MTIKWDEQFKGLQLMDKIMPNVTRNPWKGGVIGYAPLPGSDQVLDRDTGAWPPSTGSSTGAAAVPAAALRPSTSLTQLVALPAHACGGVYSVPQLRTRARAHDAPL